MGSVIQNAYHSGEKLSKRPHFHDCHQIIFIVKGTVVFCVNDKMLHAAAGDAAIFSRYENHSVVECSEEYERFVLHIDPDVVNHKSAMYSLLTDRPVAFCNIIRAVAHTDQITAILKQILWEHSGAAKHADEMEQLLVKQLLILLCRCTAVDFGRAYDAVVSNVKRQFENACFEQYTLNGLAKQYGVSVSSLSHRFLAATGVPVMEYLQSCRMANAKQMLAETDSSIGQIVEKCGFSDNSNFSRIFKKRNGLSPSDFRKQYGAE